MTNRQKSAKIAVLNRKIEGLRKGAAQAARFGDWEQVGRNFGTMYRYHSIREVWRVAIVDGLYEDLGAGVYAVPLSALPPAPPHIVSGPSTAEQIAASDNAVIKHYHDKSIP